MKTARLLVPILILAAFAAPAQADPDAGPSPVPTYLRLDETEATAYRLEIAVRTLARADGQGPTITLVGVSHIGDPDYYGRLQTILDAHDVVLYESVRPEGAGRVGGSTDAERAASTLVRLRFLAGLVRRVGDDVRDVDALRAAVATQDPRLAHFVDDARRDAWGHPIRLEAGRLLGERVTSLGADGRVGGSGAAADLGVLVADMEAPGGGEDRQDLVRELADALGFTYQMDGIDYARSSWRACDMSLDEVRRATEARGGSFASMEQTLSMQGLDGERARMLIRMLKGEGNPFGPVIKTLARVMIVTLLSSEMAESGASGLMDQAVADAILLDRNTVVLDGVDALLAEQPDVGTLAIFYGAAHMRDLEQRLGERRGYVATATTWLPAMTVDLSDSPLPPAALKGMRNLLEVLLRQRAKAQAAPAGATEEE